MRHDHTKNSQLAFFGFCFPSFFRRTLPFFLIFSPTLTVPDARNIAFFKKKKASSREFFLTVVTHNPAKFRFPTLENEGAIIIPVRSK